MAVPIPAQTLVGHWKLDETSGTTAADSTSNANDGTLHDGLPAPWITGKDGGALDLSNSSDYVLVPHDSAIDFSTGSFTVMFWLKQDASVSDVCWLAKGTNGGEFTGASGCRYELYHHSNDSIHWTLDDASTKSEVSVDDSLDFATGEWVHVAGVRDASAGMLYLYADGELAGSASDGTGDIGEEEDLYFGRMYNGDRFFTGALDDVRIYNDAMTQDEIQAVMAEAMTAAGGPSPADGAIGVATDPELTWTAGSLAATHAVYFGTSESAVDVATTASAEYMGEVSEAGYSPGKLADSTAYYWRVDEINSGETESPWMGGVWSFTTAEKMDVPVNPFPADGATAAARDLILRWDEVDGADRYDVYFGETNPPEFVSTQPVASASADSLTLGQTYYWRVDARSATGLGEGELWQFTVSSETLPEGWSYATQIAKDIEAAIASGAQPSVDFSVMDYGAVADGVTSNTVAFAAAISACNAAGGGRVLVPAGDYYTGPVKLLDNVDLHVESGARLYFSTDPGDYESLVLVRWEGTLCYNYSPLIYAVGRKNIAVTGEGTFDGQAAYGNWWDWKSTADTTTLRAYGAAGTVFIDRQMGDGYDLRPNMIQFIDCENVLLEDFTILNSPMWTIHPVFCHNVIGRNLNIYGDGPNTDGFNPESCDDVLIDNCYFNTGDDCIAIKSGRDEDGLQVARPSRRIIIKNCDMDEGHGAVTIGSEMSGGVRHVFAEDNIFDGSEMETGLRFKTARGRGGVVEYFYARNIEMGTIADYAIKFNMYYSGTGATGANPTFRHFYIDGVTCDEVDGYALYMYGLDDNPIDGVAIDNVTVVSADTAAYINNVDNLCMYNVVINGTDYGDATPCVVPVEMSGFEIE